MQALIKKTNLVNGIKVIFSTFKKYFIFIFFFVVLQHLIFKVFNVSGDGYRNPIKSILDYYGVYISFLLVVLCTPILEELVFRYGLTFRKINTLIGILVSYTIFPLYLNLGLSSPFTIYYFLIVLIFWLGLLLIYNSKQRNNVFIVSCFSALLFGILHIGNFPSFSFDRVLIFLWFVVPQIYAGYLLSKLRIENGISYSILFHMLVNFIGFCSFVFMKQFNK